MEWIWGKRLLSTLLFICDLYDMDINVFRVLCAAMCGPVNVGGTYLVMKRSELAYTPSLEYILPHPYVCELLQRYSTVPVPPSQRGHQSVFAERELKPVAFGE